MTGEQLFAIEPIVVLALLGIGLLFAPLFDRLTRWIEDLSLRTAGLILIGLAAAFSALLWLDPP